jgi:hypothetical protein
MSNPPDHGWHNDKVASSDVKQVSEVECALLEIGEGRFFFAMQINGQVFAFPDDLADKIRLSVPLIHEVLVKDRRKGEN